jgi:hypothetical protein
MADVIIKEMFIDEILKGHQMSNFELMFVVKQTTNES